MYNFFSTIDKSFVINLIDDEFRKKHVVRELNGKCCNYEIIEAVSSNDYIVKKQYKLNNVLSFPPCFRCNLDLCEHENNFITPKQVANFFSFKKIMEIIVEEKLDNVVIFEDDFKFSFNSKKSFKNIDKFLKSKKLLDTDKPFILRIGSHTIVNKIFYLKFFLTQQNTFVVDNLDDMANPCFLINLAFAKIFLKEFGKIEDTSDNFIHRKIVEKYNIVNYSVYPFPVRQLSYGRKKNKFISTITSQEDINRVNSKIEYQKFLKELLNAKKIN